MREIVRMARPEVAHHPLKDVPREVARGLRTRFQMNGDVKNR